MSSKRMRTKKTNIPFLYKRDDGRFIVLLPLETNGKVRRKLNVGRFTDKVNAFIAMNKSLGDLFSVFPLARLGKALRHRRHIRLADQVGLVTKSGAFLKKERKTPSELLDDE